jgi:hypothetical protein
MEYKIVLNPNCYNDIIEIGNWYHGISVESVQFFYGELKQSLFLLKQDPFSFPNPYEQVHCLELKMSQYFLYYYIDEANSKIVLLTVLYRPTVL